MANDRHASNNGRDVSLGDVLVVVKIVDIKDELHLLVELAAIDPQQPREKFFRAEVAVAVRIEHSEETLSQQARQLAVVQKANLVHAFGLVVTATAEILVDVFEVGQTDFHFEVVGESWF